MDGYTNLGDPVLEPASPRERADILIFTLLGLIAAGIAVWDLSILSTFAGFIGIGLAVAALYFTGVPRPLRLMLISVGILILAAWNWLGF